MENARSLSPTSTSEGNENLTEMVGFEPGFGEGEFTEDFLSTEMESGGDGGGAGFEYSDGEASSFSSSSQSSFSSSTFDDEELELVIDMIEREADADTDSGSESSSKRRVSNSFEGVIGNENGGEGEGGEEGVGKDEKNQVKDDDYDNDYAGSAHVVEYWSVGKRGNAKMLLRKYTVNDLNDNKNDSFDGTDFVTEEEDSLSLPVLK